MDRKTEMDSEMHEAWVFTPRGTRSGLRPSPNVHFRVKWSRALSVTFFTAVCTPIFVLLLIFINFHQKLISNYTWVWPELPVYIVKLSHLYSVFSISFFNQVILKCDNFTAYTRQFRLQLGIIGGQCIMKIYKNREQKQYRCTNSGEKRFQS